MYFINKNNNYNLVKLSYSYIDVKLYYYRKYSFYYCYF